MATSTDTRFPSSLTPAAFMADAAACGVHFLVRPDGRFVVEYPAEPAGIDEEDVRALFADRRFRAGVKRIAAKRCARALAEFHARRSSTADGNQRQ